MPNDKKRLFFEETINVICSLKIRGNFNNHKKAVCFHSVIIVIWEDFLKFQLLKNEKWIEIPNYNCIIFFSIDINVFVWTMKIYKK